VKKAGRGRPLRLLALPTSAVMEGPISERTVNIGRAELRPHRKTGRLGDAPLVRLRVRTNSGVKVPVGQNTGCP
jgi:hypothetical protein